MKAPPQSRSRVFTQIVGLGFLSFIAFIPIADAYDLISWLKARTVAEEVPFMKSTSDTFRVEVVAEGLESPWAIVPAPGERLFITERPGRLRVVENGAGRNLDRLFLWDIYPMKSDHPLFRWY